MADVPIKGEGQRPTAAGFAGWYNRLPFDPAEGTTLLGGLSLSGVLHIALAYGFIVYGLTLSAHGELAPHDESPPPAPIAATFVFEQPEPATEIKPHLIPQAVPEPPPKPPTRAKTRKRSPIKKVRTARRAPANKPAKDAAPMQPTPSAAIAPAAANSNATTVAEANEPEPAVNVASGPTTTTAPSPAAVKGSVDRAGLLKSYVKKLSRAVRKRRAYPRAAKLAGLEGRAVVRIVLNAKGAIINIELASSSGHDILDRAALEAARSVGKLPAAPSGLEWGTRAIKVPFSFKVAS